MSSGFETTLGCCGMCPFSSSGMWMGDCSIVLGVVLTIHLLSKWLFEFGVVCLWGPVACNVLWHCMVFWLHLTAAALRGVALTRGRAAAAVAARGAYASAAAAAAAAALRHPTALTAAPTAAIPYPAWVVPLGFNTFHTAIESFSFWAHRQRLQMRSSRSRPVPSFLCSVCESNCP